MEYGIVLGAPRSGTSFLMDFLDAMPGTECVTGNLLPTAIPHIVNQELSDPVRDALLEAFRKSLSDYLQSGLYHSRSAALRKWLAARDGLLPALRGERRADRLVYKEPFLAFAPEYAYTALPEARLVYIYRDGRDVADSMVRSYDVLTDEKLTRLDTTEMPLGRRFDHRYVPWWVAPGEDEAFLAATPYVRSIWMWREMVRRCDELFGRPDVVAAGGVLQVRYEDFVQDPVEQGRAVARHLGGPFTSRMRKRAAEAHARSVGIHQRRDSAEVEQAERVAATELARYGYL